jgi:hypothetical protein
MKIGEDDRRSRIVGNRHVGITKQPFRDGLGRWWIYRSDDPKMITPMGPFFTKAYAAESEEIARARRAQFPAPLSHKQPAQPNHPIKKPWLGHELPDITDGINYND